MLKNIVVPVAVLLAAKCAMRLTNRELRSNTIAATHIRDSRTVFAETAYLRERALSHT